ncbi:helix-turn-helix domain-containing protein [Chryseobacterium oryctis]|uniref:Helix-turn-helix domain-containing protein n=1 Tax=Chryseobacterium oryctis TaxID=2952618 RepID=A0ABT3HIT5_9FLAO|nr:helix-turn-helix domain-containing protein [Chryseobacterium oryctis]MCW3159691.1 helix-turn-helix domain-containing protein [Chryseobacterium oryctis]
MINFNFEKTEEPIQLIQVDSITFYELLKQVYEKLLNHKKSEKKEWLTPKEAMSFLNIKSKTTLAKLRQTGAISYSQFGKKILYHSESIQEYLNENTFDRF